MKIEEALKLVHEGKAIHRPKRSHVIFKVYGPCLNYSIISEISVDYLNGEKDKWSYACRADFDMEDVTSDEWYEWKLIPHNARAEFGDDNQPKPDSVG